MKIYLVGGAVRDILRGKQPSDRDFVVVGASPDEMLQQGFREVGHGFPVFLHPKTREEYALARKEIKTGRKHTDFRFIFTPDVTLKEDLQRRDFTCNAIAQDPITGELIDYFGGQNDIKNHILRHVDARHFPEDPLRVMRLCRFAAQLNFDIAPETRSLCAQMVQRGMLADLTAERLWAELLKAMSVRDFARFVTTAYELKVLHAILPEIASILDDPARSPIILRALNRRTDTATPLVFFGILTFYLKENEIYALCRRFKVPNKYKTFALCLSGCYDAFSQIRSLHPKQILLLFNKLNQKHQPILEPFIEVCQHINDTNEIQENANFLRDIFSFTAALRAQDMPDFERLPKDDSFKEKFDSYRAFKIKEYIKSK